MDSVLDKFLAALEQTERLPPTDLARYQAGLVERIVRHAYENSPLYRARLACLFRPDGSFDPRKWREVPVLGRDEAAANTLAMRIELREEEYGLTAEKHTSGTVGASLRFTCNGMGSLAARAGWTRFLLWHGARRSGPFAVIRFPSDGRHTAYPAGMTQVGIRPGESFESVRYELDLRTPVEQQLEWLLRHKAPYLITSPSNALALAYAATPKEVRALGIERVFAFGETIAPGARETVAERLGAKLAGIYSCEEVGPLAAECAHAPHYHVFPDLAVVEVLDDEGNPAAPGEIGRVVITGLYNYATPFIRYAIGDVASASDARCACGRIFPVLAQVDGRARCAFVFRDGKRVWPRSWDVEAMRAFVPFREFQMVQIDYERVEFRYVPEGEDEPDIAGLAKLARARIHPSVEISAVRMEAIPRGPGGKFEQFLSQVGS